MHRSVCMDLGVILKVTAKKDIHNSTNEPKRVSLKRCAETQNDPTRVKKPSLVPETSLLEENSQSQDKKSSNQSETTPKKVSEFDDIELKASPVLNNVDQALAQSSRKSNETLTQGLNQAILIDNFQVSEKERKPSIQSRIQPKEELLEIVKFGALPVFNKRTKILEHLSLKSNETLVKEPNKDVMIKNFQVNEEEKSEQESEKSFLDKFDTELNKENKNGHSLLQAFRLAMVEYYVDMKKREDEYRRLTKNNVLTALNKELIKVSEDMIEESVKEVKEILENFDKPLDSFSCMKLIVDLLMSAFKVGINVFETSSSVDQSGRIHYTLIFNNSDKKYDRLINLEMLREHGNILFKIDRGLPFHRENENIQDYLLKTSRWLKYWFNYMDANYESCRELRDQNRTRSKKYSRILQCILKNFGKDRQAEEINFPVHGSIILKNLIITELCNNSYYYTNELLSLDPDILERSINKNLHPLRYFIIDEFFTNYHSKGIFDNWTVNHDDFILEIIANSLKQARIEVLDEKKKIKWCYGTEVNSEPIRLLRSCDDVYELHPSHIKPVFDSDGEKPYSGILDIFETDEKVREELLSRKFYYEQYARVLFKKASLNEIILRINEKTKWKFGFNELLLEAISNAYNYVIYVYYYDKQSQLKCTRVYQPVTHDFLNAKRPLPFCKLKYSHFSSKFSEEVYEEASNLLPTIFDIFNPHPKPFHYNAIEEFMKKFCEYYKKNRKFVNSLMEQYDSQSFEEFLTIIWNYLVVQTNDDRFRRSSSDKEHGLQPLIDYKRSYDSILFRLISCVFDCKVNIFDMDKKGRKFTYYYGKNKEPSKEINLERRNLVKYVLRKT